MQVLQIILSGVSQGCIYGLIALGFVLIYKATETVTFAQGELMMLGAFAALGSASYLGWSFAAAVLTAIVVMAVVGWMIERVFIHPVLGEPAFAIVMLSIGIGYVARGVVTMIPDIGTETHTLPVPYADARLDMGGLILSATQLIVMLATALDRKSTRLNSSHVSESRMPSSA